MIAFGPGVSTRGIAPALVVAMVAVSQAFEMEGQLLMVRSCTDGDHGEHSLHYNGLAFDAVIGEMPSDVKQSLLQTVTGLGLPNADFSLKNEGTSDEYLCVEINHPSVRALHRSSSERIMP